MRKVLKNCKRTDFKGMYARQYMKLFGIASAIMAIVAVLCFFTGTEAGAVMGVMFAGIPLVAFKLPEGVEFTENEKKAVQALAEHFTKQFGEYAEGLKSQEDFIKSVSEKLKEKGFDAEKIGKIEEVLKAQGGELKALKEKANNPGPQFTGLKAAFMENYDKLKEAVKTEKSGFIIKAPDEHNAANIHTTGNVMVTTTGANLVENSGIDPNLYLKRRGRQYIHDIASVSYVEKVPEDFSFDEEGDETGAIAVVAENGLKPQVKLQLIRNKVSAKKAAGYIVVTEEVMKWRTRAWAAIQRLFSDKVYRDYEKLLTTQMLTNASAYISTPLDGTIEKPTDFEALIAAILQMESLNFAPDTLVINPADKWRLALTQTNNGMFILPYIQEGGKFGLLGLNVITTTEIAAGQFLIGEAGTWFIEEEAPQLRTGLVNDDLIHNRMTIVGEIFFLSYVPSNNAGGWVKATFADIKEALTKVAG